MYVKHTHTGCENHAEAPTTHVSISLPSSCHLGKFWWGFCVNLHSCGFYSDAKKSLCDHVQQRKEGRRTQFWGQSRPFTHRYWAKSQPDLTVWGTAQRFGWLWLKIRLKVKMMLLFSDLSHRKTPVIPGENGSGQVRRVNKLWKTWRGDQKEL